jgi:hypothetical protein
MECFSTLDKNPEERGVSTLVVKFRALAEGKGKGEVN